MDHNKVEILTPVDLLLRSKNCQTPGVCGSIVVNEVIAKNGLLTPSLIFYMNNNECYLIINLNCKWVSHVHSCLLVHSSFSTHSKMAYNPKDFFTYDGIDTWRNLGLQKLLRQLSIGRLPCSRPNSSFKETR